MIYNKTPSYSKIQFVSYYHGKIEMIIDERLSELEVEFVLIDDKRGIHIHSTVCGYAVPQGKTSEIPLGKFNLHLPALSRLLRSEAMKNGGFNNVNFCHECILMPRRKFRSR